MSGPMELQRPGPNVSPMNNVCPVVSSSMDASNSFSKNACGLNLIAETPIRNVSNFLTSANTSLKRWNSVPTGINFTHPPSQTTSSPSASSSISSESSNFDAAMTKGNLESTSVDETVQKSTVTPMYLFERRPSSTSAASVFARCRYSSDAVFTLAAPVPARLRDRGVEKLKREANIRRCIETDYASEKLSLTGAAIMGSLDEFTIEETPSTPLVEQRKRTQSLTEPVHVLTNFLPSPCSPSPTRIEKQCYSPSMQQVVRGIALSPATSPSPNRHHCVRSLSPIAIRGPSLKRKYDSDTESYYGPVPAKRVYSSLPSTPPFTPQDRFPRLSQAASQSVDQSLSANSMDSESSTSTISSDYTNVGGQQCKIPFYQHHHQALTVDNSSSGNGNAAPSPVSSMDLSSTADSAMDET